MRGAEGLAGVDTVGGYVKEYAVRPDPARLSGYGLGFGDLVEALEGEGHKIAKNQIVLDKPIKSIGVYDVKVALHPEVAVTIQVNVARSPEEAELQASGKSIQDLAAEEDAAADFEIAELFEDIGSASRDEDEAN